MNAHFEILLGRGVYTLGKLKLIKMSHGGQRDLM